MINAGMVQLGNSGSSIDNAESRSLWPEQFRDSQPRREWKYHRLFAAEQCRAWLAIVENANASSGQVSTLTVNDSGTDTFAGVMRDDLAGHGLLAIGKSGAGTLVLTASNTYSGGTTINAGDTPAWRWG